jgi:ubiquinone/menaquinone biosynthesis C-methylase UbiE
MLPQPGSRFDFDRVADSYDAWYDTPAGILYDRIEKRAVAECLPPPSRGDRLLEVGAGTGHWSRFFSAAGFRVFGIDLSRRMTRVAGSQRAPGTVFLVGDARSVPFASRTFDLTAAITLLEFVTEPEQVLSEMARCTRPGGTILVGALNRNSLLGIRRRLRPSPIFANAEMPTVGWIRKHLAAYGTVKVGTVAFSWPRPGARPLEWAGRKARLPWGDFIVASCRLQG